MSALIAEGELNREARRVLLKLIPPLAHLASNERGGFAVMTPARTGLKSRIAVSADLVEAFRRRDWLAAGEGATLVLSDAGLGWIRRVMAEENPFAAQHRIESRRQIAGEDGLINSVTVNEGESPLGWLRRRRGPDGRTLIGDTQFQAGEKLRADFTLAQLSPRLAVDLTAPVVAGRRGAKSDTPFPEIVLAAKQRFKRALDATGPGLADLLVDVCCHLVGLEDVERRNAWPQRSAKVVLLIALDRLAAHYGLGPVIGTGSRIRAWAAPEEETNVAREP